MCKPINIGGHAAYQAKMISLLKQYYPDAFTRFGPSLWDTIGKFYSMDLTQIDVIMYDRYSVFGPVPRLPSDMIRSMMVTEDFAGCNEVRPIPAPSFTKAT